MKIDVEWTGQYPSLCCGSWIIEIDGKRLKNLENNPFDTKKEYNFWKWSESDEWDTIRYSEVQGLDLGEWVDCVKYNNLNNLRDSLISAGFKITNELLIELFENINIEDFQMHTCGGCI